MTIYLYSTHRHWRNAVANKSLSVSSFNPSIPFPSLHSLSTMNLTDWTNNNNNNISSGSGNNRAQWLRTCNELRKIFQRIEPELEPNSSSGNDSEKDAQRGQKQQTTAMDQRMFQSRLQREISYALGRDSCLYLIPIIGRGFKDAY